MAGGALEVSAFLRAVDWIVARHRRIGLAIAVVIFGARKQHTWPEEVSACLCSAEVAMLNIEAETTQELGSGTVCATNKTVLDSGGELVTAALVVTGIDIHADAMPAGGSHLLRVGVKGIRRATRNIEKCDLADHTVGRVDRVVENVARLALVLLRGERVATADETVRVLSAGLHVARS